MKGNEVPFTMELFADLKQYPEEQAFLKTAHSRIIELAEEMEELENKKEETKEDDKKNTLFPFFF